MEQTPMMSVACQLMVLTLAAAPAPCIEAQTVDKPCSGLLVPFQEAREALGYVVKLEACQAMRSLVESGAQARLAAAARLAEIERQRGDRLRTLLDKQSAPPVVPWYEAPAFVAPVSAIAAIAVVLLSIYAAGAI